MERTTVQEQQNKDNVKRALYISVLNKMIGDLSELEAKEVLLTSVPAFIILTVLQKSLMSLIGK
jgi:hypothetical protein